MKCLFNGVPLPALPAKILAYPHIWIHSITDPDGKYVPFRVYATEDAPKAFLDSDGTTEYWGYETKATGISATVYIDDSEWTLNNYAISACTPYGPGWTNTDAYHLDGTLWVAASDPIPVGAAPVLDPLSLFLGWKAGNWVARQRGKKKQPVAFLYNGVRLPGLPEWDKEKYPYALIRYEEIWDLNGNSAYQVCFLSSAAHYAISADNPNVAYVGGADIGRLMYVCEFPRGATPPNVWEYQNELSGKFGVYARSVIWSDYDILDTANSTVYLSASDPVPVYE